MEWFLLTLIVVLARSIAGKLIWLATGNFPERRASTEAWGVVVMSILVVWAVILLPKVCN